MQYLLSVIHDSASLATPSEAAAIDIFNERLQAEGHWVFAVGLGAPTTATVIDNRAGEPVFTRRTVPGIQGVPCRLLDHRGSRPRRGPQARRRGIKGLHPEGRGAAAPERVSASPTRGEERIDRPGRCRIRAAVFVEKVRGGPARAAKRRQEASRDDQVHDPVR